MFLSLPRILSLVLALTLPAYGDNEPAENTENGESATNGNVVMDTAPTNEPAAKNPLSLPKQDVNDFDIFGVKLGMTWDEARAALKENLQIGDKEIVVLSSKTRLPLSGKLVPNHLLVKRGYEQVEVWFNSNALHKKPDELAVWIVSHYSYYINWDDYLEIAAEKYGKYEYDGDNKGIGKFVVWCNGCTPVSVPDVPHLIFRQKFTNLDMELRNEGYQKALEEFEAQNKGKIPNS